MNTYYIKMYHTQNLEKSAIIERFHRTLNNRLKTQFEVRKNKNGITVLKAFKKIIQSAKSQNHKPSNLLHNNKSTEFENKNFKTLLNTYNIKMYHT